MSVICVCHTSSHLRTHTFTSSHITSSYLHLHILTPSHSHSHISHLHKLTSSFSLSHSHIFTSSLTYSNSHFLIFLHSHLHILTSAFSFSRTHIFTYSHFLFLSPLSSLLALSLLSLPLFSLSPSLSSLFRPRVVPARSHETSTLSHEMRVDAKKPRYNCDFTCAGLVQENLSHEIRVDAQTLR